MLDVRCSIYDVRTLGKRTVSYLQVSSPRPLHPASCILNHHAHRPAGLLLRLILVASIIGGMVPVWFQLTHRWMQFAVSFVAGVMLGIGVLHMLPHAITDATAAANAIAKSPLPFRVAAGSAAANAEAVRWIMISLLAGMLDDVLHRAILQLPSSRCARRCGSTNIEHDPRSRHDHCARPSHGHRHADLSWSGAAFGLALHSMLNGVALAAAVQCETGGSWLAGFGTFLVIFLHKPFDAMTISMLMGRGGWSLAWRHTINGLFSLAIPVGVLIFYFGLMPDQFSPNAASQQWYIACALAFSAGTFFASR